MNTISPISCGDKNTSAQPRSWRCFFFIAGVTRCRSAGDPAEPFSVVFSTAVATTTLR
jgi:hypothetical protein